VVYEGHIEEIPLFGIPDFLGLEDFSDFDASSSRRGVEAKEMLWCKKYFSHRF